MKSITEDRKKKITICFKNSSKIKIYSVVPGNLIIMW